MATLQQFIEHTAYNMRVSILKMTTEAGSGHPTSALSAADIVATLFLYAMQFDPKNPNNPNNDRFILSKGHACPVLYAIYKELGVLNEKELLTYRDFDSVLEGHPTPRFSYSEAATGSLGQGLSIGLGMALAARLDKRDYYTYVMLGDSECAEGSVWEAIELAAYYKTHNLIAILDENRLGQSTPTMYGHNSEKWEKRFAAFGWKTFTVFGHDIQELMAVFDQAKKVQNQPVMIIAKTYKGYGVEQAEDAMGYHGKPFSKEELPQILQKLRTRFADAANPIKYDWKPKVPSADRLDSTSGLALRSPRTASGPVALSESRANEESRESSRMGATAPIKLPQSTYKLGDKIKTREVYGEALAALGFVNNQVVSLDAEVKNSTYAEIFENAHPDRFFQCFIAEQNMMGMAVGMQARGKIPFASTFACFLTRAFDQIRMAAIGQASLRICGSHAGVSIGEDGPSQMGLEDIAMIRAVPTSIVLYPCDATSTYKLVEVMANRNDGISYLRTTRMATPVIYDTTKEFSIGGCQVLKESATDQCCIVAAGVTLHEALKAYELLKKENITVSVIDAYSVKPLDSATIAQTAYASNNRIITVEDHYLEGGLGQTVAYELRNSGISIECLAVTKMPRSGKPEELLAFEGIDAAAIVAKVKASVA